MFAGVPHGKGVIVRCVAQGVYDLERRGLLADDAKLVRGS